MRRTAIAITLLALLAGVYACSSDAPGPTTPKGGPGQPPTGTSRLQIRLFTSDPNPPAGSCTQLQAIVTLDGVSVSDGTGVSFSTNFGIFSNGLNVASIVTQDGAAVTALCAQNPGTANVRTQATVSGQTGTATITIAFQPVSSAGPFFTFCSPSFGPAEGGTILALAGGRFFGSASTTRVTFVVAGVEREALVTDVTESSISLVTPGFPEAVSPSVPVEIRVTLGTNTATPVTLSVPNCFAFGTVSSATPTVTAVLPSSGPNEGNTRVTIIGAGFQAPSQVFFGNVEAQVLSISFNQIVVLTPGAFGAGSENLNQSVNVRVRNVTSGIEGSLDGGFRYVTEVQLTSISNNQQRVDFSFTPVTIFGHGFQAPVAVTLAGISASVLSVSATELVVLPGNPALSGCADIEGDVSVTNITTGDSATGLLFRYLVAQSAPAINFVTPATGDTSSGAIAATISGSGLLGVTNVTFGGRPAVITSRTSTSIGVLVPDNGADAPECPAGGVAGDPVSVGAVDVVVTGATTGCTATLSDAFTHFRGCVVAP